MNQNQIAAMYRQISTRGSNPVGLVVKLYETILEDFRRASDALASGDVEQRVRSLNHALLIIAELESVLDHDRGGHIATQLQGFYRVTRTMIMEANIHASQEQIAKLIGLYMPFREAWQRVERSVAGGTADVPDGGRSKPSEPLQSGPKVQKQKSDFFSEPDDSQSSWSA